MTIPRSCGFHPALGAGGVTPATLGQRVGGTVVSLCDVRRMDEATPSRTRRSRMNGAFYPTAATGIAAVGGRGCPAGSEGCGATVAVASASRGAGWGGSSPTPISLRSSRWPGDAAYPARRRCRTAAVGRRQESPDSPEEGAAPAAPNGADRAAVVHAASGGAGLALTDTRADSENGRFHPPRLDKRPVSKPT